MCPAPTIKKQSNGNRFEGGKNPFPEIKKKKKKEHQLLKN
jgi:hypothetical protein